MRVNAGSLPDDNWLHDPEDGGGRLLGEGCHFVDLLCHLAFNAPLRTRRERAERVRREKQDFFDRYGSEARSVLDELLDKYAEHGAAQFVVPDVLRPFTGFDRVAPRP